MPKLCNIDIEHRKEVFEGLKKFIARLKDKFAVEEIYLYGSFATGQIHENSDIDLLIVGDFKGRIFKRIADVIKLTDLPVEPLVYTPEEFIRMKQVNPFIKGVIRSGKKLFAKGEG